MCSIKYKRGLLVLVLIINFNDVRKCNAITNAQFNASLRDYSTADSNNNSTNVKTLQRDLQERYAHVAPVSAAIRFKEVPDSVLSGSSHGRGLLHLNHHGYGLGDYEENPHYGYEYHYQDDHYGPYDDHHHHQDHHHQDHHGHHLIHHDDHKHGYGHHHKHYDHGLATKAVLWPIAGIALLGAAAALVTNPVLLQLGVVSGKRRRRDAEELNTDKLDRIINNVSFEKSVVSNPKNSNKDGKSITHEKRNSKGISNFVRTMLFNKPANQGLVLRNNNAVTPTLRSVATNKHEYIRQAENKHYIPIPLKINNLSN